MEKSQVGLLHYFDSVELDEGGMDEAGEVRGRVQLGDLEFRHLSLPQFDDLTFCFCFPFSVEGKCLFLSRRNDVSLRSLNL